MVDFSGSHIRVLQKEFFTLISLKSGKGLFLKKHKVFLTF